MCQQTISIRPQLQIEQSASIMLHLVLVSLAFLGTVTVDATNDAVLKAGVLGVPGSNDAQLYRTIADYLHQIEREELARRLNVSDLNDSPRGKLYCRLDFEELNFDTTNAQTVRKSLNDARNAFEDDVKEIAIAVGPYIPIFASTNYVIVKQTHLLTSPAGANADMIDPSKVVSIIPEPSTVAAGIAALVKRLGWTDVAFLSDNDFSPVLALNQLQITVWPIRLSNNFQGNLSDSNSELHRSLIALRQSERDKFILHTNNRQVVLRVLSVAQTLHLLHMTKDWLITYPDFSDVAGGDLPNWPGSIIGLQLLNESRIPEDLIDMFGGELSRLDIALAMDVVGFLRQVLWIEANQCSRIRLFGDYYVPAPFLDWHLNSQRDTNLDVGTFISPEIVNRHLRNKTKAYQGALGRYVWDATTNRRTDFSLDIVRFSRSNFTKLGEMMFIDSDVPNITMEDVESTRAEEDEEFSFDGETVLMVATKQIDPFVIRHGDEYVGFSRDLLEAIGEKCNFKFELMEVEDYVKPSGEFVNGMVHALVTGKASIAVGAMEVTSERQKVISFSYTILSSQASILIKKERKQASLFQFMSPFATGLWLLILLFINVATFSLYVMSRFDPTQEGNANRFDLKESLWYGWNIILQGTTDYSPSTTSMRAIIAFFWFCVVIIDAAYTANLAAFRTLQQIDDRIKNLHDLASQTKLLYGVEKGSDIMHFFQTRYEDPYERMWAFMKLNEDQAILANTTEIVEMVKGGKMAFIADGVTNDYYVKQHCGIESIEQSFGKKDFSLGFPKGAPYLDNINKALLELKEEGVLDTLKERWWMMGTTCTEDSHSRSISQKATAELELTSMTGIFIVLGGSVVMAIVVGVAEACYKVVQRQKAKKKAAGNNGEAGKDDEQAEQPLEMDGNVMENYYTFS